MDNGILFFHFHMKLEKRNKQELIRTGFFFKTSNDIIEGMADFLANIYIKPIPPKYVKS